jgi:LmbE family N-acetylglucosaminyl deacetylase
MKTIVIAPYPDDEVLGAGGTIFRRKARGEKLAWLIGASISTTMGWREEKVTCPSQEIEKIADEFGFAEVFELNFPAARLDQIPVSDLFTCISDAFKGFEPIEGSLPHPSDARTDHRIVSMLQPVVPNGFAIHPSNAYWPTKPSQSQILDW